MTLDKMCQSAARYADRYDEFEKTENEDGRMVYEDDALHYLNVFRDAINEAYFEVARSYGHPDTYLKVKVPANKLIDLTTLDPVPFRLNNVLDENREKNVFFVFETRYVIRVNGFDGDSVTLYYQYLPDRLEALSDEPIFPESMVDPMVYISLAVARIWLSEKKIDLYNTWMSQYYTLLRQVKGDLRSTMNRKIPRRQFR